MLDACWDESVCCTRGLAEPASPVFRVWHAQGPADRSMAWLVFPGGWLACTISAALRSVRTCFLEVDGRQRRRLDCTAGTGTLRAPAVQPAAISVDRGGLHLPTDVPIPSPGHGGIACIWSGAPPHRLPHLLQLYAAGRDPVAPNHCTLWCVGMACRFLMECVVAMIWSKLYVVPNALRTGAAFSRHGWWSTGGSTI